MRNWVLLVALCGLISSASAQSFLHGLTYSAGGGLGIGRDDVAAYVGNSGEAVAGIGKNFNRLFGMDVEYMYYDLNFRPSVKQNQFLSNESGRMQSISLDGIVNVPRHIRKWGAYGVFGVGFYRRTVSIPTRNFEQFGVTTYQPAWRWWDIQRDITGRIITPQTMSSNSKDAGGFNYGGGLTHPINHLHNANFFIEMRYHRAYQSDGKTIVVPVTVGLRW